MNPRERSLYRAFTVHFYGSRSNFTTDATCVRITSMLLDIHAYYDNRPRISYNVSNPCEYRTPNTTNKRKANEKKITNQKPNSHFSVDHIPRKFSINQLKSKKKKLFTANCIRFQSHLQWPHAKCQTMKYIVLETFSWNRHFILKSNPKRQIYTYYLLKLASSLNWRTEHLPVHGHIEYNRIVTTSTFIQRKLWVCVCVWCKRTNTKQPERKEWKKKQLYEIHPRKESISKSSTRIHRCVYILRIWYL